MTNFEKILKETTRADMAAALRAYYEGYCGECPANKLCREQDKEAMLSCSEVLLEWLGEEAEDAEGT